MSSEHVRLSSRRSLSPFLAQVCQQLSPVARNEAVAIHVCWSYHTTLVPDATLLGIVASARTVTTVSDNEDTLSPCFTPHRYR